MNTININPSKGYPQIQIVKQVKSGYSIGVKSYDPINVGDSLMDRKRGLGVVLEIKEQRPARGVYEGKERPTFYQVITKV